MIIYKIVNKINKKIYVGQTKRTLKERMEEHVRKNSIPVDKDIEKYGIENFDIKVIDVATNEEELNDKEKLWIRKLNCMLPKGYNQTFGGKTTKGFTHREQSKEKMSKAKSKLYVGSGNPFFGKRHSEESKEKMSKARKGRKLTTEWKEKIGLAQRKKVINLDTGEVFDSIKSAAVHYELKETHITRVCKGKRKTTGGFRWAYYNL